MAMMGRYWKTTMVATVLWTVVVALGVAGTMRNDVRILFWAALLGLVACMVSAWLLALCAACAAVRAERLELEHLATIMAGVEAPNDVPRIR